MAEQVEIIDINLNDIITDGQEAGQTLKELKEQVKDLRKQLDDCAVGSDKFASTLDELTTAQEKLKKATKTSIDAVEGSYDALVVKMGELKKAWRATADEAERSDLGAQIADINQQLKDMDASIGNYQRNVGDYASAFDNVTMKIEGGVAKFDRFNNATRSVIGSFDLVEGGLKAIGVESEEVNALMDSMQGAMMLTNGLNSIKEGVQAFTALRASVTTATAAQAGLNAMMMANPIGAVVAAVAVLTAGITALVKIIRKNRDEEAQLKAAYEATNKVIDDRIASQELEIQLMEARGEAQADILKKELEYAELNKQTTEDRIKAIETELNETGGLRRKKKKLLQEQLDDLKDQLKDQEKAVRDANNAILIYDTKTKTEQVNAAREAAREKQRLATETANKEIEEARRAQEEINKTYQQRKLEREEYWLDELQLKSKRLEEWVEEEKEIVRKQHENGLIAEQEYLDQIFEIDKIYYDKKRKLEDEANQASVDYFLQEGNRAEISGKKKEEEAEKTETLGSKLKDVMNLTDKQAQGISAGVSLMGTAFSSTTQLLDGLANSQDRTTEEGFAMWKKLSIASATMQMLQGVVSAWASSMQLGPIAGPIMGGILTASTIAMGTMNINNIKKQTLDNAGKDSGSGNTPQMPAVNTAALLSSPVNYTTEIKGAKAVEDAQDTRVYVLESDITSTVDKVRVVEEESTY